MDRSERIVKTIVVILVTALITFILTTGYILKRLDVSYSEIFTYLNEDSEMGFSKLNDVFTIIKQKYYKDISNEALEDAAIRGLLYGLNDPYSYYMNEEDYENFMVETTGNYTGVGLYLTNDVENNAIKVISAIKDTPAYKAGIKTGDYILEVEGETYTGLQMQDATSVIKHGETGTEVKLTILSDGKRKEILLKREEIDIYKIQYEILGNNIGYINIPIFDENSSNDFKNIYNEFKEKNVSGIIIDVRNNPGGLLDSVVEIADILVPKDGIIVYTVDRNGNRKDYNSNKDNEDILPIVILVNEGSASASEILASAIKDHGLGTVVGTKSYGKGVVQSIISMPNNSNEVIKLTTSEYFSPNGNEIDKIGVLPDVEVKDNKETKADEQLNKALEILKK